MVLHNLAKKKKRQTSHPLCEETDSPDSVPAGLEVMNVHQAVVIATGFMLFCVKAPYDANTGHCLIHSMTCQSH